MYYCSHVWANTTNKNVKKLQAVQNFACRIVSGAKKYDHVTPLLKSLSCQGNIWNAISLISHSMYKATYF